MPSIFEYGKSMSYSHDSSVITVRSARFGYVEVCVRRCTSSVSMLLHVHTQHINTHLRNTLTLPLLLSAITNNPIFHHPRHHHKSAQSLSSLTGNDDGDGDGDPRAASETNSGAENLFAFSPEPPIQVHLLALSPSPPPFPSPVSISISNFNVLFLTVGMQDATELLRPLPSYDLDDNIPEVEDSLPLLHRPSHSSAQQQIRV